MRAGQALRGSSEFHAWGDSNLYLRRDGDRLTLSVEHRAAPSISSVSLHLDTAHDAVALAALDHDGNAAVPVAGTTAEKTVEQRILAQLEAATTPLTATALRKLCQLRNATLQSALAALVADGQLVKDRTGYVLVP